MLLNIGNSLVRAKGTKTGQVSSCTFLYKATKIRCETRFVINHPAVTAAIIGPRTMEQLESQLPAAEVTPTADILDRIDQLVARG